MTTTLTRPATVDTATAPEVDLDLVHVARTTLDRAHSLRTQAAVLPEILAATYRRRASELELEAFLIEATAGLPDALIHRAASAS